jgi:hypothetical protein
MRKLLKPVLFLFIISTFSTALLAQSFDVSWGDKAKLKYDFDDAVPIGGGKTIVLKLKASGGGLFGGGVKYTPILMLVNENTETLKENELSIEEKNSVIKGFEKYGKNVFFLYSAYDKETKNTSVYALKIDEKTLAPISKTTLGTYESDSKGDQAQATYKLSQDSSKVLLFVEGPERKKENKKFYVGVFDTDLKKQWAKEIELPILEKFVSIYDMDVTDDAKVFVAIKHYDKEVKRETVRENGEKIPSYVYKLLVYASGNAKEKEITFNTNNNFIQGTKLTYNKNGTVTVAGLYKQKHNGRINGAFYATFDGNSSEVKNPKMVAFDPELIRLVDKDGFGNKKESDPGLSSHFRINHILPRPNGSVDLISEYYTLDISYVYDKYGSRTYYRYQYGDIVNTNIDKDGKAVFTRIPKNQKFIAEVPFSLFLGYYPLIYKDKLVLLFNDDKDNIDRDLEKKPDDIMKFKNSVLAAATIDTKGGLSRQAIFSNDDEDYIALPRNFARVSENTILISSDLIKLFKKRTRFGIMKIK